LTAILEENDGALWMGSESSGLLHRAARGTTDSEKRTGFSMSPIHAIELDSRGGLWISGNEGLFRIRSEHEERRNGRLDGIPVERFSRRDGLRNIECNGWGSPASTRLPDGRFVYPTQRGIAVADADAVPEGRLEPHEVRVLEGWARDRVLELGIPVYLDTDERSLRLRFSAIETVRPEAVTFRYRLERYDDDWLLSDALRQASYDRLAPGKFTFRLQARLPGGPWVESARSLQVIVAPFVWETAWFRGSLLLVVLSLAVAGYRFRVAAIERHSQELETMVAERTRSLEQRERELLEAKEAAEAANRAKSTFLSTMSHELRTPLNAILGFAQILARDTSLAGEQRDNARIIGKSGEHLLGLIDDVLEMSKIEAGRSELRITEVDLEATIQTVEQMMRVRAEEKGLALTVVRARNTPAHIRSDEPKLRQVLINLIGNAIQYTPRGGVELRVSAVDTDGRPAVRFEVVDTGVGIDPERAREIFEPFVRHENDAAPAAGTGLGLAISREYVKRMGGDDIHVTSRPGEGSRFSFTVPHEPSRASTVDEGQPLRRVVAREGGQTELRVLVADDDASGRTLLRRLLEPLGFAVEGASSGREAMELYRSWHPDAVLMDLRMPEVDGLAAARGIREAERGKPGSGKTLIIGLSAEAFEENREKALAAGCDVFVTKPFRESEIFELLGTHLGVRYAYEDVVAPPKGESGDGSRDLAPRMRHLSSSLLAKLEQAAAALDPETLASVIEIVRSQDAPAAEGLTALAREFDYLRILTLARDARETVDA
jgi:two-component system sensor histidine kinase/response regulator